MEMFIEMYTKYRLQCKIIYSFPWFFGTTDLRFIYFNFENLQVLIIEKILIKIYKKIV